MTEHGAGLLLLMVALATSAPLRTVTIDITLAGPGDSSYELAVDGRTKTGRIPAQPGLVTVLESMDVPAEGASVAALAAFANGAGVFSRCAPVAVSLQSGAASCSPSFTVTQAPSGLDLYVCQSSCLPARRAER